MLAQSREEAALHTAELVSPDETGFHHKLRQGSASQVVTYLAVELDLVGMRAHLSQQRAVLLWRITPRRVLTTLLLMPLLGMMSVAHVAVPLGLLHMRWMQRWFIHLHIDPVPQRMRMVLT